MGSSARILEVCLPHEGAVLTRWLIRVIDQKQNMKKTHYTLKVLPAIKVARYLQIENKIRTIINFDIVLRSP